MQTRLNISSGLALLLGNPSILKSGCVVFKLIFLHFLTCFILKPEKNVGQSVKTGKSLSEALILASTNPQYDNRLLIELQVQYMKIPSSEHG